MCESTYLGRFKCRDGKTARISDSEMPPDTYMLDDENTLPADQFRAQAESGEMADRARDAMETFVAASNARWAKPKPKGEPDNQEEGETPFGKNLSARPESLHPTPGERYEQTPTTDSAAKRFIEASKARWAKK